MYRIGKSIFFAAAIAVGATADERSAELDGQLNRANIDPQQLITAYWRQHGERALQHALTVEPIQRKAQNIILFIGDGNGVTSVTATRIFDGQSRGLAGEEHLLSFEQLPHVALAKTYNTNQQTPDSAGTMTAIMTGVKTAAGVVGLGPEVELGNCHAPPMLPLRSLLDDARARNKATGIVTTARVTHATPAAIYAHAAHRNWESDADIPASMKPCGEDIASQLVAATNPIDVVFGGGRANFLPATMADPEYPDQSGKRQDGRNLIAQWQQHNSTGQYLWNAEQFAALPEDFGGNILGLFEPSHLHYEADREALNGNEPSLSAMTAAAIERLAKNRNGYFLMVEAGRIDHGHHAGNAYRALTDGQELARAVQIALDKTNAENTLIIVTADHSHVITMAGYPTRGNPILGQVVANDSRGHASDSPQLADDGKPYTTLSYSNGRGYGYADSPAERYLTPATAGRHLEAGEITTSKDYHQEAHVPLGSETHGGEDVAIYARGPWAHLLHGVQEQNYLYYVMRYALSYGED